MKLQEYPIITIRYIEVIKLIMKFVFLTFLLIAALSFSGCKPSKSAAELLPVVAAPVLTSAAITNSNPTNTTSYSLSYGAIVGEYVSYCRFRQFYCVN